MKKFLKFRNLLVVLILAAVVAAGGYVLLKDSHDSAKSGQSTTKSPSKNTPGFNKQLYSTSDPASKWVIVNKQRPLNPKDYAPGDLLQIGSGQRLRREAAAAYRSMVEAAAAVGFSLVPESGYRSYNTQISVYGAEVSRFGKTAADMQSARPGYSEHQTGWAVDIAVPDCIEDCFGKTAAAAWVMENAPKYGFVQRYIEGKTSVTGYRPESWHFRYVGSDLAQEVAGSGQTLEEFFGLPPAANY